MNHSVSLLKEKNLCRFSLKSKGQISLKKKVRIIIGTLAVGGCERHLSYVLPKLKKKGWDLSVITLGGPNPLAEVLEKQGITTSLGKTWYSPKKLPAPLRKIFFITINTLRLLFHFQKDRTAINHFFLPHAYVLGGLVSFFTRYSGPLIMSRRSTNDYQKKHPLLTKVEHFLHQKMTRILGNSQRVCDQLIEEDVTHDQIGIIYNGIDTSPFEGKINKENIRDKFHIPQDSLVFTMVANLLPYKGHPDLLKAFHLIKDELSEPWKLLLVGRDDGMKKSLEDMVKAYGLEENVIFTGPQPDPTPLLKISDVCVLSSHEEGFSNSLLEGMAAGLPIVATDVGGNKEAVLHKKTGFIVPRQEPALLSKALLAMAKDKDLRKIMGEKGQKRLHDQFSLDACVDNYHNFYMSL